MKNTTELWYLLIQGQQDSASGFFGNFYAFGNHLGDAFENTIKSSAKQHFKNQNLIEATLLENFEQIEKKQELVKIAENVYMRPTFNTFPWNGINQEFVSPTGIVKSVLEGEYEYDLIQENFVAFQADDEGIFEFELVVTKHNLIDTFIKTIEFLPSVDGCWIYIKSHWEGDLTELWVAKQFTDKRTVIDFLQSQKKNTLENGYIELVVHSLVGETNLTLDDHKKLQLHTKDEETFNQFINHIRELGYQQTSDFYNLEFGYHHLHYRPADSLTRTEFKQMLADTDFELIDKWEE